MKFSKKQLVYLGALTALVVPGAVAYTSAQSGNGFFTKVEDSPFHRSSQNVQTGVQAPAVVNSAPVPVDDNSFHAALSDDPATHDAFDDSRTGVEANDDRGGSMDDRLSNRGADDGSVHEALSDDSANHDVFDDNRLSHEDKVRSEVANGDDKGGLRAEDHSSTEAEHAVLASDDSGHGDFSRGTEVNDMRREDRGSNSSLGLVDDSGHGGNGGSGGADDSGRGGHR